MNKMNKEELNVTFWRFEGQINIIFLRIKKYLSKFKLTKNIFRPIYLLGHLIFFRMEDILSISVPYPLKYHIIDFSNFDLENEQRMKTIKKTYGYGFI